MDVPKTARAAVLVRYNSPLEVQEIRIPDVEPDAILVKNEVAGVCGGDVHLWNGDRRIPPPFVLGHETLGRIARLGSNVKQDSAGAPLAEGDRIMWTHASCDRCYFCRIAHQPNLCPNKREYGWSSSERHPYLMGGWADFTYVVPHSGIVKVPDELPNDIALPAG